MSLGNRLIASGHPARAVVARLTGGPLALANRFARLMAQLGHPIEVRGRGRDPLRADTPEALVKDHFARHSDPDHVNYGSLRDTLALLEGSPSLILETGSSAWGTDSSRLFDAYVTSFGGEFRSVDIRLEPMRKLRSSLTASSTLSCDDSVRFLDRWVKANSGRSADLVYLDSWDLDVSAPLPAAIHGLREFLAIEPALRNGSLLLIDDTPADPELLPPNARGAARDFQARYGMVPGKGMLVDRLLQGRADVTKVHHHYQVLYRFESAS